MSIALSVQRVYRGPFHFTLFLLFTYFSHLALKDISQIFVFTFKIYIYIYRTPEKEKKRNKTNYN